MSETKGQLSKLLEGLEIKAGEFNSGRFTEKAEQIKSEASERFVKYFIDAMCTILNAKENEQITARQSNAKMHGLYKIAKENLNDSEFHYLTVIDGLLIRTQALMETMNSTVIDTSNIYNEALNDNIKLPKLDETWKAIKEGYTQFIIIPSDMILNEIIAKAPDFIRIDVQELKEHEFRKTAERPGGFYTLALSENENAIDDYPEGRRGSIKLAKSRMADFAERLNLNLSGLTIKEYIWAQLFHVMKVAKSGIDKKTWGLDYECASYLLDDRVLENQKFGEAYLAVGFWSDNSEKPGISIANNSKGIRSFLPVVPRLAVNFAGDRNE